MKNHKSKIVNRKSKRGRPPKPKRSHCVTLTLTLPNAAFRLHLKRQAKAAGHKTPSALIIATFPLPVSKSQSFPVTIATPAARIRRTGSPP